jgi:hypothetical protein
MSETKTFSFKNVNAIFGVLEIEGWSEDDDCLAIEYDEDAFTKVTGNKGDVVRIQSNDSGCKITMKLLQPSVTNKFLSAIFNADRELQTGALPFIVTDKEAGETWVVNSAWILKYPKVVRGKVHHSYEWVLDGDFLTCAII